jgi:HK97 family phage portal protein
VASPVRARLPLITEPPGYPPHDLIVCEEVPGVARRTFLPALRERFAPLRLETKALPDWVRASSQQYLVPGVPYRQNWSTKRAVEEAFIPNPTVYRCVEVLCANAIGHPVQLRQGDPEDGPVIDTAHDPSRLLYTLNRRANPWETARIFKHRLVAQFVLSSKGMYVEVIRSRGGGMGMLNLLDPDLVEMVPNPIDPMHAFRVQTPNSKTGYDYLPRFDPNASPTQQPSSIHWIRNPHPTVMWNGTSPVQAAGMPIDLDKYARLYNRRFLQNDGRPGGLLSIKGTVSQTTMELLQSQFQGGPESAGRTTVIQADGVSYADTSGSPRDTLWGDTMDRDHHEICMCFGVPESVMGDASGRTYANADAEYGMFWEHRMLPLIRDLDDQLETLAGVLGEDIYLRTDLSKVWVLGRYQREHEDRLAADQQAGYINIDDVREAKGHKRLDVPATRVLFLPIGKAAVADTAHPHDAKEAAAAPVIGPVTPGSAGSGMAQIGDPGGGGQPFGAGDSSLRLVAGAGDRAGGGVEGMEAASLPVGELEGKQSHPRLDGSEHGARHTA